MISVGRGIAPTVNASPALGASRPTRHVDHIGRLGAGTAITDAQPPLAARLDHVAKIDHA